MNPNRIIPVLLVAAALPNVASAATLFLKQNGAACTNSAINNPANPQKYVGLAVNVPRNDGSFTLTIDNPAGGATNCTGFPVTSNSQGTNNLPISVTVGFTASIVPIHFFKDNECQDQGANFVGLTASGSQGAGANAVAYTFGFALTQDGCPAVEPTFNRTARLDFGNAGTGTTFTGNYHLYNVASVPEPGSLALLGLGLSALVFVGRRRAKRGK